MTEADLQDLYREFNKKYFSGVLPEVPILFTGLKSAGAYFTCKVRRTKMPPSMTMVEGTGLIKFDTRFVRTDEAMTAILLHEMIHVWIAVMGIDEKQMHGPRFMAKLREVSQASGIEIPKTEKMDKPELADKSTSLEIGVVLVETKPDVYSFAVVAPARFKKADDVEALLTQWNDRIRYKIVHKVTLWTIESEKWTVAAMRYPIQRKALTKLSLFLGKDRDLIEDLFANGTKVAETNARPITDEERDEILKKYPLT